jgi:hypothetical protein
LQDHTISLGLQSLGWAAASVHQCIYNPLMHNATGSPGFGVLIVLLACRLEFQ